MTTTEALRWLNLITFVGLLAVGWKLLERPSLRGYAFVLIGWALNNVAFTAATIWLREWFTVEALNGWSSATKLQAAFTAYGIAWLAWKRRR